MTDSAKSPVDSPPIRVLSDRVVNQIAAGEVIERPAAVVKELVENSLDAGSTRVEVEFRHGGKSYIRIEDNGCGMRPDDALLALERHATSKLREADDLLKITSLGFRGEALPSIASVSRFTLKTRRSDWDHGTEIFVNGGKMIHQRECGMPPGTRIEVVHLFNSVPARRKFLKTDNTEAAHIVHLVRLLAVARPEVAFTLIENGRTVFRSPECPTMNDRVAEIWGRQVADQLIELPEADGKNGLRIKGLIGQPGVGRSTRREMIALVNGRAVDSRTLNYALIEGYHTFIPKGRYPIAFLFLEIDPAAVDVNIHPAKREIRFRDEGTVRRFVLTQVQDRLRAAAQVQFPIRGDVQSAPPDEAATVAAKILESTEPKKAGAPAPAIQPGPRAKEEPSYPRTQPKPASEEFKRQYVEPSSSVKAASPAKSAQPLKVAKGQVQPSPLTGEQEAPPATDASLKPAPRRFRGRLIGRLKIDYALFETESGLMVLRLRAAHERVQFERIVEHFKAQKIAQQQLLFPVPMEFDPRSSAALQEQLEWIQSHGFSVEEFGRNFYRMEAHPDWLPEGQAERFFRDLVDRLREGDIDPSQVSLAHEQLAKLAATRAVRMADDLPDRAVEELAEQLFSCDHPLACPNGRPTIIELSANDLRKRFGLS
ncbi:MAG: DNA mismatch repair endonuclease MutL [Verrucomicrobiota bacterium]